MFNRTSDTPPMWSEVFRLTAGAGERVDAFFGIDVAAFQSTVVVPASGHSNPGILSLTLLAWVMLV